jgi:hypothetical protein
MEQQPKSLPPKNSYKILFFVSLGIFLVVISVLVTLLITQKSSKPVQTANDPGKKVIPAQSNNSETTNISTNSSVASSKTDFQKLLLDFGSYKEIDDKERSILNVSYWPSQVESTDKLYSFTQKLLKGSIKKIKFDKDNLKTLIGIYQYIVYITPNYENWTNEYFSKTSDFNHLMTGIGDLSPIYAYPDKLIWSTTVNCGGVAFDPITHPAEAKEMEQCTTLVNELETAFP